MAPPQGGGGSAGVIQVVHMHDAALELSDLVCRRFSIAAPRLRNKRGPLASLTLQSRSPPRAQPYQPRTLRAPRDRVRLLPTSSSAPPPTAPPTPTLPPPPPPPGNGQQSGSASHPGTPKPQALNPSPKLLGVDSLRSASTDGRWEREECDRHERREKSPE
ncbi:hypothetical protein B0H13DRAFT_2278773 [Mycena leptocephala]|nr:hypothetical protein B0H13DRAFT_2278773 [Mycena leptocephala]